MNASTDTWFVATGEHSGFPVVVRGRRLQEYPAGIATYSKLIRITWQFGDQSVELLPGTAIAAEMGIFEEKLVPALESERLCLFFSVYTHNGVRQWCAYTSDVQLTCDRMNNALAGDRSFPIQITVEDDAEWREYQHLLADVAVNYK